MKNRASSGSDCSDGELVFADSESWEEQEEYDEGKFSNAAGDYEEDEKDGGAISEDFLKNYLKYGRCIF